jgi:hypothetical protein
MISVLTATFNRAHTLPRVWESLRSQTFSDFEWVVVDDGSADGTEALVQGFRAAASFPIVYLRQDNKGKHVAINRAVVASSGELLTILDSDDSCVARALERFAFHWRGIPASRREEFYAVACHCADPTGRRIGDAYPRDVVDARGLDARYRWKVRGEKWGAVRADLMRAMPFPPKPERTYLPESLVWDRLGLKYFARFVNEDLRVYHLEPGASSLGSSGDPSRHAWGSMLQHRLVLNEQLEYFRVAPLAFAAAAAHYVRFSRHAGVGAARQLEALEPWGAKALWCLAYPAGWAAWANDRRRRWTSS